jgi:microcystin-dependent protein
MKPRQNAHRRTFLSRLPFIGAFVGGTATSASAANAFDQPNVTFAKRVELLEKAVAGLQLPIGTVIPFGGDATTIPSGHWLLCDGRECKAADYPELARLLGQDQQSTLVLPDWSGCVIRGASKNERVFSVGGSDQSAVSVTAENGKHNHQLPGKTGLISDEPDGPLEPQNAYSVARNGSWSHAYSKQSFQGHIIVATDSGKAGEGHHRHFLGGETFDAGNHTHEIPALAVVPRHVAVRFLIKAK